MKSTSFVLVCLPLFIITVFLFFQNGAVWAEESEQQFSLPSVFEYPPVKGRDPFSPLVKPPPEKPQEPEKEIKEKSAKKATKKATKKENTLPVITESEYQVVGLVWNGSSDVALITKGENIWLAQEGMVFDGLKVARIKGKEGEVVLIDRDKIIRLTILGV